MLGVKKRCRYLLFLKDLRGTEVFKEFRAPKDIRGITGCKAHRELLEVLDLKG
jgi:hypothetical protein